MYAFLVQPGIGSGLNVSYLMYIGKTDRPLRKRFREYLGEVKSPKGRHKVRLALELWKKYLWFSCAVAPPSLDRSN